MNITLKLFATLSDYLPEHGRQKNRIELEVPSGTSVAEVIARFNLPERQVHLVLVNGFFIPRESRLTTTLEEGDHLAIWPPVAGG
jgi:thiamine biosynthesis protein ThiS